MSVLLSQSGRRTGVGLTRERGYGRAHQAARRSLGRALPAPCGYCGAFVDPAEPWVAAHRIDGDPSAGWLVAHPACNERAKRRHQARRPAVPHPGLV